ncbi:hypothetical protein LTR62_005820 [Meristemomyces frigidus]|uniref:C2H2-type domain-containing protein n=1 Tax=Meristemomyces frigidus TaxID=1508187 RepID=A0AAN7YEZ0_9PEZI|nr:hypothetical protein LTR62_005820 [Meristemomyces frigidus]
MSSASTPSRYGRGINVPGIETQFEHDKRNTALSYAGYATPPPSAHDSRRGSLAFGAFSDPSYNHGAVVHCLSQPVTPMQAISLASQDFPQQWQQRSMVHAGQPIPHNAEFAVHHMTSVELESAIHQASNHYGLSSGMQVESVWHETSQRVEWTQQHGVHHLPDFQTETYVSSMLQNQACLPVTSGLANSTYCDSIHTNDDMSLDMSHPGAFGTGSESNDHHQQSTVIPSMLTPGDGYMMQPYQDYSSPNGTRDSLTNSFASSNGSFSSLDYDMPSTPTDVYDGDWTLIAAERPSATPETSLDRSSTLPIRSRNGRQRRTTTRPTNRAQAQRTRQYYVGSATAGIMCELRGPACDSTFDLTSQRLVGLTTTTGSSKLHRCTHLFDSDKPCNGRFLRGEHLKRHMASHSQDRKYGCGLPDCRHKRGISRGDNAGDHFRTHLKDTAKGRRNQKFQWPEVRALILLRNEEKEAKRLITNLTKWIRSRAEGACQRHWLLLEEGGEGA